MGILDRFTSIVKANINELLDKAEDPEKMVDQYLREMTESLAEVREATAGVMAEEKRRIALSVANFFQPKLAADHRAKAALPAWVRL